MFPMLFFTVSCVLNTKLRKPSKPEKGLGTLRLAWLHGAGAPRIVAGETATALEPQRNSGAQNSTALP
jgi:hypothetical protein